MAYVPPALRKKARGETATGEQMESGNSSSPSRASTTDDPSLVSINDIRAHFWPEPVKPHEPVGNTLHASGDRPASLAYVLLFHGANPRWDAENVLYAKTRIDLLPGYDEHVKEVMATSLPAAVQDGDGADPKARSISVTDDDIEPQAIPDQASSSSERDIAAKEPVAVFSQVHHGTSHVFKFVGWYKIVKVAFLEPKSPELVRMLEQKWQQVDRHGRAQQKTRDPRAWNASLTHRWAVTKFERNSAADAARGPLFVQRLEHDQPDHDGATVGKSVNELLAELRMHGREHANEDSP